MFTRSQVEAWRISALTDWAATLKSGNETVVRELDTMTRHFEDVRDDWKGLGYDAARDHAATEHSSGLKVTTEVDSLHTAATQGAAMLTSRRDVLLNKVADAVHDGCTVADDWKVSKTVPAGATQQQATDIANAVKGHQDAINGAVSALKDEADTTARGIDDAAQRIRVRGDEAGDGDLAALDRPAESDAARLGEEDGKALADEAAKPPHQRDNTVFDRVASQLPTYLLTDADLKELAAGREVATVPQAVQEYYRDLYRTAGKDGVLALSDYLKGQESAGNPTAASARDALANGFTTISNEKVGTGRDASGKLVNAGGYQYVPKDMQQLIERRANDLVPIPNEGESPSARQLELERNASQLSSFSDMIGQANPGYQPGTELGTRLYEKAADMTKNGFGQWAQGYIEGDPHGSLTYLDDPKRFDWAAGTFADIAGRNNEASYQIWAGEGMHEGYNREETIRSLTSYDWSGSDGGRGASTLFDWITDGSNQTGTPLFEHAQQALAEAPRILAGDDATWSKTRDSFAHAPELATAMSRVLTTNPESMDPRGYPAGWGEASQVANGHAYLRASELQRLMELGSYSHEGQVNLATQSELQRAEALTRVLAQDPNGDLTKTLALQGGANLAGRVDDAMRVALIHQNELGAANFQPEGVLANVKLIGASLAGELVGMGINRVPYLDNALNVVGAGDVSGDLTNHLIKAMQIPEYDKLPVPNVDDLRAQAQGSISNTILRAAQNTGVQLPPELWAGDQPISFRGSPPPTPAQIAVWEAFQQQHGLAQYVTDYLQSYAVGVK
ncbi:TPR repeat region-containing protein [Mycobacteroides abscessus]|uniref:TPR repeat region-containing protein n=1 Tax=Mycobacteroides abscessus TaxID=36809 RepID=UPI0005DF8A61|nr:hypothetical protein [Mycobacteroides abscessus]CPW66725.1 Conserved hypothetical protein (peptidase?) [Mycobacteroides abscessus]SKF61939.1 Uncharacterised protein [Mycobacteroides abscessus subsp. bolletii]SKH89110.1 Uncharacterised protein [Mycobacteroides abscessus subsp. bolletii]